MSVAFLLWRHVKKFSPSHSMSLMNFSETLEAWSTVWAWYEAALKTPLSMMTRWKRPEQEDGNRKMILLYLELEVRPSELNS